jgi:ParB family chromosome partitioning protein
VARKASKRKKQVEPRSRGLSPAQVAGASPPAAVSALAAEVEADGGRVIGSYKDPLGGSWQLLVALPIDAVAPTPYQRDLSDAHVEKLRAVLERLDRFLDPIIAVRKDGSYWTPNGNHRLAALRELGARTVVALLVPEAEMAYQILALNTEKAHNLRERSLEVIRMARDLAALDPLPERDYAGVFEDPVLLTLGCCYEQKGRFPGSIYQPVLRRVDSFQASKLPRALEVREARAARLLELEEAVGRAVAELKERGFESPYLKTFVVARINPIRFQRTGKPEFDETLDKMLAAANRFQAGKIKPDQIARSGGPPEE